MRAVPSSPSAQGLLGILPLPQTRVLLITGGAGVGGAETGCPVGALLGKLVGASVGFEVGADDGDAVGFADGDAEGGLV